MPSEREKVSATVHPINPPDAAPAQGGDGLDPAKGMDQVREILFGESRRSTEKAIQALDKKVDDLAATMSARLAEIMALITEVQSNAERSQASAIDEIGVAISQLSSTIRNVSGARKAK